MPCSWPFWLALMLGAGCAGPSGRAEAPTPEVAKPDLFPELSAGLERQMAEQRSQALARGAEMKAQGIDPFEGQAVQSRLEELRIPTLGGCALEPGRLHREPAFRAHGKLAVRDFRALDPSASNPRLSEELLARRAVIPVVFVSCNLELVTTRSASGGYEVRAAQVRFAAFFDARLSWMNPRQRGDASTLAHAQLHFDLANLLALEANRRPMDPGLVGRGPTRETARDDFSLRWADQMGRTQTELRRFEIQLDRETTRGWDLQEQARWTRRIGGGLAAVRSAVPAH